MEYVLLTRRELCNVWCLFAVISAVLYTSEALWICCARARTSIPLTIISKQFRRTSHSCTLVRALQFRFIRQEMWRQTQLTPNLPAARNALFIDCYNCSYHVWKMVKSNQAIMEKSTSNVDFFRMQIHDGPKYTHKTSGGTTPIKTTPRMNRYYSNVLKITANTYIRHMLDVRIIHTTNTAQ